MSNKLSFRKPDFFPHTQRLNDILTDISKDLCSCRSAYGNIPISKQYLTRKKFHFPEKGFIEYTS